MTLADDLARVLDREPFGLPCHVLARRVHRRRAVVRAALDADERFEHDGRTHGSRWRVAASMVRGPNGNSAGPNERGAPDLDASGVPLVHRTAGRRS
jgi:hypothetical protein